jgi:type VII secretion-associated serine protease mycosin
MSFTRTLRAVGGAVVVGALLFGSAPVASADQIRDEQWPLVSFQAEKVWKVATGKGVTVALMDNGVNGDHTDLKGSVLPGKSFSTGDPANQETKNNHGTSMASIVAGHGHGPGDTEGVMGLAPDAKILPVKVSDGDGGAAFAQGSIAEPLRYAVDQGAKIVNMSFAGYSLSMDEKQAIAYAVKKDVLLVAGSGNTGTGDLRYPAAAAGVVAVGAVGPDLRIWEDSNYGSHLLLAAPGRQIRSAGATEEYQASKGTSDATAYVSAAAALLRSKFPKLTAGQVVNRLTKTALIPKGVSTSGTPDPHYGYGIIRPYRALTENIPAGSQNGPMKLPDLSSAGAATPGGGTAAAGGGTDDSDSLRTVLGVAGFGLFVLVVVGIIVAIVVLRKKRNRRNGPPPGGGWGGGSTDPLPQSGPSPQQAPNPYACQPQPSNQRPNQ